MRDPYQPGHLLVLPSGHRVRIERVRGADVVCNYERRQPGDRRHGIPAHDHDLVLTKAFCILHCLLIEAVPA